MVKVQRIQKLLPENTSRHTRWTDRCTWTTKAINN